MERENGFTRSIIDDFHSWESHEDQMEAESMVLLKLSSMNLILVMSKEMKWKLKVVLLEESLMNFIPAISNEIKW